MAEQKREILTKQERNALRAERSTLDSPIDRIAFDNRWVSGIPLGLVLKAYEDDDKE